MSLCKNDGDPRTSQKSRKNSSKQPKTFLFPQLSQSHFGLDHTIMTNLQTKPSWRARRQPNLAVSYHEYFFFKSSSESVVNIVVVVVIEEWWESYLEPHVCRFHVPWAVSWNSIEIDSSSKYLYSPMCVHAMQSIFKWFLFDGCKWFLFHNVHMLL